MDIETQEKLLSKDPIEFMGFIAGECLRDIALSETVTGMALEILPIEFEDEANKQAHIRDALETVQAKNKHVQELLELMRQYTHMYRE